MKRATGTLLTAFLWLMALPSVFTALRLNKPPVPFYPAGDLKIKKTVYEKQVVFWGRKYATKARAEREEVLRKSCDLVANPQRYLKATSYGAVKYVLNVKYDEKTGEILDYKDHPTLGSGEKVGFSHTPLRQNKTAQNPFNIGALGCFSLLLL